MANPGAVLIGYARVSTDDQNMALQRDALIAHGVPSTRIFEETASGASVAKRPALAAAIKALRADDVLVVWKIDRLGRNLEELILTVKRIQERGANLRCLTQAIDTTTPGGRLVFHIFGAMAEFERDLIRERTMAGLAAAKERGRVGGRKPSIPDKLRAKATQMIRDGKPMAQVQRETKIGKSTLYKIKDSLTAIVDDPAPEDEA